jgi:hypothetical protein
MLDTKLTRNPRFIRGIKGTENKPLWAWFSNFLSASDDL